MDIILRSLTAQWEAFLAAVPQILLGIGVFIAVAIVGQIVSRTVRAVLERGNLVDTHRGFIRRLVLWAFLLIGFTLTLNVLGFSGVAASILTGGGVTAVVLGFAFREIGENFLAGFFLAFERPFNHGDLIQSGDVEGVVRGISLRSTHIRTADGKDVFVPSSQIFKNPLTNYTIDGLRRFGFGLGIDYGDDPLAAAKLMLEAVARHELVLADPAPTAGIKALASSYVEMQATFWVNAFDPKLDVIALRTAILADCRQTLLEAGFTLSSDVTTNLALKARETFAVTLEQR